MAVATAACGAPTLQHRSELTARGNWQLSDDRYAALVAANKKLLATASSANEDPLCRAILERRHARVKALLAVGVDLRTPRKLSDVVESIAHRKHERSGAWASLGGHDMSAQPLQIAALKADAQMVQILLDGGAPVDGGGEFTALVAATERTPSEESAAVVDVLLRAGASPDGLPRAGMSIGDGAPVDCKQGHPLEAWHPQCASKCAPLQRVLMRPGRRDSGWLSGYVVDRSASGTNGDLVETIQLGHWPSTAELTAPRERIVRALLAAGASADPPANWHDYYSLRTNRNLLGTYPKWRTCPVALWAGIYAGLSDDTVTALSARTKHALDANGWKEEVFDGLEVLALERSEPLMAQVLREQLPRMGAHEQMMALDLVSMRGASSVVASLLAAGVKPSTVDNAGRGYVPALVSASAHCDVAAVSSLLAAGANPNRRSEVDGARPLNVACPAVAPLLQAAGAVPSPRAEIEQVVAKRAAEIDRLQREREASRRDRDRRFAAWAGELRQMSRDWEAAKEAAERRRQAERESVSRAVSQGLASGLQHAANELRPAPTPSFPSTGSGGSAAGGSDATSIGASTGSGTANGNTGGAGGAGATGTAAPRAGAPGTAGASGNPPATPGGLPTASVPPKGAPPPAPAEAIPGGRPAPVPVAGNANGSGGSAGIGPTGRPPPAPSGTPASTVVAGAPPAGPRPQTTSGVGPAGPPPPAPGFGGVSITLQSTKIRPPADPAAQAEAKRQAEERERTRQADEARREAERKAAADAAARERQERQRDADARRKRCDDVSAKQREVGARRAECEKACRATASAAASTRCKDRLWWADCRKGVEEEERACIARCPTGPDTPDECRARGVAR